jgi:hypothetical protein
METAKTDPRKKPLTVVLVALLVTHSLFASSALAQDDPIELQEYRLTLQKMGGLRLGLEKRRQTGAAVLACGISGGVVALTAILETVPVFSGLGDVIMEDTMGAEGYHTKREQNPGGVALGSVVTAVADLFIMGGDYLSDGSLADGNRYNKPFQTTRGTYRGTETLARTYFQNKSALCRGALERAIAIHNEMKYRDIRLESRADRLDSNREFQALERATLRVRPSAAAQSAAGTNDCPACIVNAPMDF